MHVALVTLALLVIQLLAIPLSNVSISTLDRGTLNPYIGVPECFSLTDATPTKRPDKLPTGLNGQLCLDNLLHDLKEIDTSRPPELSTWSTTRPDAYFKVPKYFWARMIRSNGCATRIYMKPGYTGIARQGIWDFVQAAEYIYEYCAADTAKGHGMGGSVHVGHLMGLALIGTPKGYPPDHGPARGSPSNPPSGSHSQ